MFVNLLVEEGVERRKVEIRGDGERFDTTTLLCENFIDDGHCLRIVDYELSGNNDACFDLGNTAQEASFDDALRAALCEAYFGRLDRRQLARMNRFALMSDVGWTLWGAIQAKISTLDFDFTDYYTTRWNRALTVMESDLVEGWLRRASQPP